jgi:hypothetical protein
MVFLSIFFNISHLLFVLVWIPSRNAKHCSLLMRSTDALVYCTNRLIALA